jgi:hypothetical protein
VPNGLGFDFVAISRKTHRKRNRCLNLVFFVVKRQKVAMN